MFYQDLDDSTIAELVKDLRPQSFGSYWSTTTYAAWRDIPTTYFLCVGDKPTTVVAASTWSTWRRQADRTGLTMSLKQSLAILLSSVSLSGLQRLWLKRPVVNATRRCSCLAFEPWWTKRALSLDLRIECNELCISWYQLIVFELILGIFIQTSGNYQSPRF